MIPPGYSPLDLASAVNVIRKLLKNAKRAGEAYHEVQREAKSLQMVLRRLEDELSKPDSVLHEEKSDLRTQYDILMCRCEKDLRSFTNLLTKYNALLEKKLSLKKGMQMLKFGNDEMLDLTKLRIRLDAHKNMIVMFLHGLELGSLGRIERKMNENLELKSLVMWTHARIEANGKGQSDWTSCATDEGAWWRTFRRQLLRHGISYEKVDESKNLVMDLLAELSDRGVLDDPIEVENYVADIKQSSGIPTSDSVNQAPEAPGTNDLGSLMLKVESEDCQPSLGISLREFQAETTDEDHNQYIELPGMGETGTRWPDQLLLRMQNPIDFGELDAILRRYGVPKEHKAQWMKLFSRDARHLYSNGGLIVQEFQYEWNIYAAHEAALNDWVEGKYTTYSEELELFRLSCPPTLHPPSVKMELAPCSIGLCVRAYTSNSDCEKEDVGGLRALLTRYELVKVSGINDIFNWELSQIEA